MTTPPTPPPTTPSSHLLLPYEETTDPRYAQEVAGNHDLQQVTADDYVIVFTCPRCGGPQEEPLFEPGFRSVQAANAPAGGAQPAAAATSANPLLPMSCHCPDTTHPGCPAGRGGCGAYWIVELA